ncbi:adenosylcobinamide-GDP ribazoletransferase [Thermodesulfovibrio aggregans]|uniref:Adenosylcobinamide-GDP ribazoletransferase n=1 Tax=Thermodesulfovibrio aggregans TaxID=86166 RepID=A0A0U9HQU0_9BACT|nr:adenosylcobinamide-GDP ribazoletransferase [Thermodesulfovibrio aggregans]GAQ95411.1 adenosylcobinamide-GDP ribazoletransferase [Thermodesulfovibrio aggregans]
MINRFLTAVSFLTVIPLKLKKVSEKDILGSVVFFPLVGFLEGVFFLVLVKGLNPMFSSAVIATVLLVFLFSIRGIFHLDGLSDTFDALFYKETGDSASDKLRRLEIMKDSTVGVAGVVAVVMNIICKFVLFKECIDIGQVMIFTFMFTFSRWSVIPLMYYSRPAKNTGLGAMFIGRISKLNFILSSVLPAFLLLYFTLKSFIFLPLIVLFLLIVIFILKNLFESKFSGVTGDNLGASIEIIEVVFIFCFLLFEKLWLNY